MMSKVLMRIGNKAIQMLGKWAKVVTNEATSGADLIVPGERAGVGQSARARAWILFDDFGVEMDDDDDEVFDCGVGERKVYY